MNCSICNELVEPQESIVQCVHCRGVVHAHCADFGHAEGTPRWECPKCRTPEPQSTGIPQNSISGSLEPLRAPKTSNVTPKVSDGLKSPANGITVDVAGALRDANKIYLEAVVDLAADLWIHRGGRELPPEDPRTWDISPELMRRRRHIEIASAEVLKAAYAIVSARMAAKIKGGLR